MAKTFKDTGMSRVGEREYFKSGRFSRSGLVRTSGLGEGDKAQRSW